MAVERTQPDTEDNSKTSIVVQDADEIQLVIMDMTWVKYPEEEICLHGNV